MGQRNLNSAVGRMVHRLPQGLLLSRQMENLFGDTTLFFQV